MPETLLILFAAGVMLAAAIVEPRSVTLNWLRLCGIIALSLAGIGVYFLLNDHRDLGEVYRRDEQKMFGLTIGLILLHLALVQTDRRSMQRWVAVLSFAAGVGAAATVTHHAIVMKQDTGLWWFARLASQVGIASALGLGLMDMLLGHAYLTASKMTMEPFRRMNLAVVGALGFSLILFMIACLMTRLINMGAFFWNQWGLYIGTRCLVGLIVPGIFAFMAHDCIKRRATQSATGILYVAGVLIVVGEAISLYLLRETALPF